MSFIHPLFLIASAAVFGPILFHLLLRNRALRKVLPTLRFLPVSSQQSMAMHRFKNLLLLLLRILILLLIVAAFARPFLAEDEAPVAEDKVEEAVVFALDASLSMRHGDRWDVANARIKTLVRSLPDSSCFALVLFDRPSTLVCPQTNDPFELERALADASPGYGSTDLLAAIRTATDVAMQMNASRHRIYLVSDFQKTGDKQVQVATSLPEGIELQPVRISDVQPYNAAVVWLEELVERKPGEQRIRVHLSGFGEGSVSGRLEILHENERLATREVSLTNNQRSVEEFTLSLEADQETVIEARLDVEDALAEDNAQPLVLRSGNDFSLVIITPTRTVSMSDTSSGSAPPRDANPYLKALAFALESSVKPRWVAPLQASSLSSVKHPVLLVNGANLFSADTLAALDRYVRSGGTLILFPSGESDAKSLGELAGVQIEGWRGGDNPEQEYRLICSGFPDGTQAGNNPVGGFPLGQPKVFRNLEVQLPESPEDVRSLLSYDDNQPFLLEHRLDHGAVLLFTVSLAPTSSDLVHSAAFAPFLNQLLEYCTQSSENRTDFLVGDVSPVRTPRPEKSDEDPNLQEKEPAQGPLRPDGNVFREPGIHHVKRGDLTWPVHVRIDPAESDLAMMNSERIDRFSKTGHETVSATMAPRAAILERRTKDADAQGRFWHYLLLAALIAMAIETLIACRASK
jgi:VWA domain-containing protein/aerotolerance regulator-like protein